MEPLGNSGAVRLFNAFVTFVWEDSNHRVSLRNEGCHCEQPRREQIDKRLAIGLTDSPTDEECSSVN